MAQLLYKARGDILPRELPRVYFACHPEDRKGCFQEIVTDILKISNCAVYYYEGEPELDEDYYLNLSQMNLVVMPVTSRLLYMPCRAMDVEFPYAVEHHIPVLPLMQESGLEQRFNEKCGDLQFLEKHNSDPTALPYDEKLKKYLEAVLVGDELAERVRAAFDAYIFLSYRKKDRKLAQELMRIIHRSPLCRCIAIWYDEFLTPGESFNNSILEALDKSDLFVLAVTPNLVNEVNYIMTTEYPMAKKAGKPILPTEMEATNPDALRSNYDGIPDSVDPADEEQFTKLLLDALCALVKRENDNDPVHNYLIGLAYLAGIDVELDHDYAVKLITAAAETGLTEAMEKLVTIYTSGEATAQNYRKAIPWQKELVEKARLRWLENGCQENISCYIHRLQELRAICHWLGGSFSSKNDYSQAKQWYREAAITMEKIAQIGPPEALRDLFTDYKDMGIMEEADHDRSAAKEWYCKGLEIAERIAKSGIPEDLRYLTISYTNLGEIAMETGSLYDAAGWFRKAVAVEERIAESGLPKAMRGQSYSYVRTGDVAKEMGDFSAAREWYCKALSIDEKIAESGLMEDLKNLSTSYERLGKIAIAEKDLTAARKWYRKSLKYRKQVVELMGTPSNYEDLAQAYHMVGLLDEDVHLLEEAFTVWQMLAEKYPHITQYQQRADLIEKEIRRKSGVIKNLWNIVFRRKKEK